MELPDATRKWCAKMIVDGYGWFPIELRDAIVSHLLDLEDVTLSRGLCARVTSGDSLPASPNVTFFALRVAIRANDVCSCRSLLRLAHPVLSMQCRFSSLCIESIVRSSGHGDDADDTDVFRDSIVRDLSLKAIDPNETTPHVSDRHGFTNAEILLSKFSHELSESLFCSVSIRDELVRCVSTVYTNWRVAPTTSAGMLDVLMSWFSRTIEFHSSACGSFDSGTTPRASERITSICRVLDIANALVSNCEHDIPDVRTLDAPHHCKRAFRLLFSCVTGDAHRQMTISSPDDDEFDNSYMYTTLIHHEMWSNRTGQKIGELADFRVFGEMAKTRIAHLTKRIQAIQAFAQSIHSVWSRVVQ